MPVLWGERCRMGTGLPVSSSAGYREVIQAILDSPGVGSNGITWKTVDEVRGIVPAELIVRYIKSVNGTYGLCGYNINTGMGGFPMTDVREAEKENIDPTDPWQGFYIAARDMRVIAEDRLVRYARLWDDFSWGTNSSPLATAALIGDARSRYGSVSNEDLAVKASENGWVAVLQGEVQHPTSSGIVSSVRRIEDTYVLNWRHGDDIECHDLPNVSYGVGWQGRYDACEDWPEAIAYEPGFWGMVLLEMYIGRSMCTRLWNFLLNKGVASYYANDNGTSSEAFALVDRTGLMWVKSPLDAIAGWLGSFSDLPLSVRHSIGMTPVEADRAFNSVRKAMGVVLSWTPTVRYRKEWGGHTSVWSQKFVRDQVMNSQAKELYEMRSTLAGWTDYTREWAGVILESPSYVPPRPRPSPSTEQEQGKIHPIVPLVAGAAAVGTIWIIGRNLASRPRTRGQNE